jgi:transposase-like protein
MAIRNGAQQPHRNNIVEQDQRAIEKRCAAMLGLKSFETAAITLAGIELRIESAKGSYR